MSGIELIRPQWPAPQNIVAACTTREGGVSSGSYASLNLASHVEDNPRHVTANRQLLVDALKLPEDPMWLNQTHSIRVIDLDSEDSRDGDAAITCTQQRVVVVLTADCLPVLFCNRQGTEVAAAHAGWRGLLNGVLEQTIGTMRSQPSDILAWLGPAIGPQHFEVGEEVRSAFIELEPELQAHFQNNREGHYLADLYAIAEARLKKQGVTHISGGNYCTFRDQSLFFSYRRDRYSGRQASLIYIK